MNDIIETAGAIAEVAVPAIAASRIALRRLRLFGTFDVSWLALDESIWLTADEVTNLEEFLGQRESRALLSLLATTLLTPESDAKTDSLAVIQDTFVNLARRWKIDRPSKWVNHRDEIWLRIRAIYDHATPGGGVLAEAALEFSDFVSTPISKGYVEISSSERHVVRLAELCSSIERVSSALDAASELKVALSEAPTPPIITYTGATKPATFGDLYVARSLRNGDTGAVVENLSLGTRGAPYRAVVHGAPGAGKSTFVRNLRQQLSTESDGQPALLLNVRNYFHATQTQTILEYLHSGLRASLNLHVDELVIRDGLTLGLMVVIFDGLDEITDISLRIEMVERITSFARAYPMTSILVTSRSIGYERAPLPSTTFRTFVLDQYVPGQATEYVSRWFTFIDRQDLIVEFERESRTVADLKSNPLMLSLLCVLYRERGSIPRRRRDIYADCADLLFHTWDSHRHIDQPEELHANGDRIMQEIASWVYKSQAAQNGLPESVIQKSIGIYLRDVVGVEDGEARRRAGEFLEFCATRAWLLGATGTQHGERLFGFTHRTFYEYFAAEAFARGTSDPAEIAKILLEANARDATSVLPELLLQAFDEKSVRGAGTVFELVSRASNDVFLILRLMEGIGLPVRARAVGFDRVLELWASDRHISESSFIALLTLNPDARNHFIAAYLSGDSPEAVELFLGAWAALDLATGAGRFDLTWSAVVSGLVTGISPSDKWWFTPALKLWLWRSGYSPTMPVDRRSTFFVPSASGPRPGLIWTTLEMIADGSANESDDDVAALFTSVLNSAKRPAYRLPRDTARKLAESVAVQIEALTSPPAGPAFKNSDALWSYCYVLAIVHEATLNGESFSDQARSELPQTVREMWATREIATTHDGPVSRLPGMMESNELPRWLLDWAKGKRAFVASYDSGNRPQFKDSW